MSEERYRYHLGVYSKLLRGWESTNPVVPGVEAGIVSRSEGWEVDGDRTTDRLDSLCDPQAHFDGRPTLMAMDGRKMPGGAFVYRPFVRGDGSRHYGVFSRIEARSEAGKGEPGRKFTHSASIVVEDHWEPNLIVWAAHMLFDSEWTDSDDFQFGGPIPERHRSRAERQLEPLTHRQLAGTQVANDIPNWQLGRRQDNRAVLQGALPDLSGPRQPQIRLAHALSLLMSELDLRVHGRWLSFALGITIKADAPKPGFAIRLDDRTTGEDGSETEIDYSDEDPPVLTDSALEEGTREYPSGRGVHGVDWSYITPSSQLRSNGRMLFGGNQLWNDQLFAWPLLNGDSGPDERPSDVNDQIQATQTTAKTEDAEGAFAEGQQSSKHGFDRSKLSNRQPEAPSEINLNNRAASIPTGLGVDPQDLHIDWPPVPDEKHRWVLEPDLVPLLRKRFVVLISLLSLLDDQEFSQCLMSDNDRLCSLVADAFAKTIQIVSVFSLTGDPRQLRTVLASLLSHEDVPAIGLISAREGSLLCRMLLILMRDKIGMESIHRYIARQAKIARHINEIALDGRIILVAPERRHLEELLESLETDDLTQPSFTFGQTLVSAEINEITEKILERAKKKTPLFHSLHAP